MFWGCGLLPCRERWLLLDCFLGQRAPIRKQTISLFKLLISLVIYLLQLALVHFPFGLIGFVGLGRHLLVQLVTLVQLVEVGGVKRVLQVFVLGDIKRFFEFVVGWTREMLEVFEVFIPIFLIISATLNA